MDDGVTGNIQRQGREYRAMVPMLVNNATMCDDIEERPRCIPPAADLDIRCTAI